MSQLPRSIECFNDLRAYVTSTLAGLENLRTDQLELSQQTLYRGKKACGVFFRLQGPRALSLSAIWETETNTVLFYGSCGRRVLRAKLASTPRLLA